MDVLPVGQCHLDNNAFTSHTHTHAGTTATANRRQTMACLINIGDLSGLMQVTAELLVAQSIK